MTLADTNLWLALSVSTHVLHQVAQNWFDEQNPGEPVLFCRSTQQSFLRLLTTEAVMRPYGIPPMSNRAAWALYAEVRSDRRVGWAPEPPVEELETHLKRLGAGTSASPKLWMDAYLAAFAIAGGYRLATTDRGFTQFKGLNSVVLAPRKP